MLQKSATVSAAVVWLVLASVAFAQDVRTTARPIAGRYIVVLNDDDQAVRTAGVQATVASLTRQYGGEVTYVYGDAIRGYAVEMTAAGASALARDARVSFVEQDGIMTVVATQTGATWGLDRIDQRDRPLTGSYTYNTTAPNVSAYIIDTGIRATHQQFAGRFSSFGFTAITDGRGTTDCNGHGTHVAGTVGGSTHGVAKGVTLHAVRVLGCNGSGSTSGVIAGVNWVTGNHVKPAVANMSLGGGVSSALDQAVANSIAAGVTYAVAAGNSNANACDSSPSRVPTALTVGASTNTDSRSSFSNFGTCVDVFAPGSSITSAWITSDSSTNTISGTSMASPHVAGAAALYLAANPGASPAAVNAAIVDNASVNKLSGIGSGSPNRLLYSLFSAGPTDDPPTASFTFSCSGLTCLFNGTGSTDDNGISTYSWNFGDGTSGQGATVSHNFTAGTYNVTLTVTDTASQTDSETRQVVVSSGSGAPCTNCTPYTGTLSGAGDADFHPNNSYYFVGGSGTHRGWLRGPAGTDFDLQLLKWNGFAWVYVARAETSSSEEAITYTGTSGYYVWRINSFNGSGAYTFWLQRP
jgi:serine protease